MDSVGQVVSNTNQTWEPGQEWSGVVHSTIHCSITKPYVSACMDSYVCTSWDVEASMLSEPWNWLDRTEIVCHWSHETALQTQSKSSTSYSHIGEYFMNVFLTSVWSKTVHASKLLRIKHYLTNHIWMWPFPTANLGRQMQSIGKCACEPFSKCTFHSSRIKGNEMGHTNLVRPETPIE